MWVCPALRRGGAFSWRRWDTVELECDQPHSGAEVREGEEALLTGLGEGQTGRTLHSGFGPFVGSKRQGDAVDAPHGWKKRMPRIYALSALAGWSAVSSLAARYRLPHPCVPAVITAADFPDPCISARTQTHQHLQMLVLPLCFTWVIARAQYFTTRRHW